MRQSVQYSLEIGRKRKNWQSRRQRITFAKMFGTTKGDTVEIVIRIFFLNLTHKSLPLSTFRAFYITQQDCSGGYSGGTARLGKPYPVLPSLSRIETDGRDGQQVLRESVGEKKRKKEKKRRIKRKKMTWKQ